MKTINELLDAAAERLGEDGKPLSDAKLSVRLGAYQQKLFDWRNGRGQPDTYAVWTLGEILKMDPLEVSAIIEAERAKSEERRSFWESQLKRFRSTTEVLALAMAMSVIYGTLPYSEAKAALITDSYKNAAPDSQCLLCKVRIMSAIRRRYQRLINYIYTFATIMRPA